MTLDLSKFNSLYLDSRKSYAHHKIDLPETIHAELKQLFDTYGLSSLDQGFLWVLDPIETKEDYQPWFNYLARTEGYIKAETTYPFMRTAFGDVFYFDSTDYGEISVVTNGGSNISLNGYLNRSLAEEDYLNDSHFHHLFKIALERFGELNCDECYAFLPPLALGGEIDEQYLQKVKLKEYLAILSEFLGNEDTEAG
ncbi:DUF1851 domain-containing protein [Deinococcus psychrotolerans]|uniref:DUF1851 domain-containing protein n=1 Tax=Deinococcus psychrotolerans TaxID=2489213 RepID=A0A3G8YQQ2_9DEIO|nr:T6SS immunity protein Tdi1 domain-containing protein [Deinococcus psychrotolerans]AZI44021.1 DUF1851 domain-containing protein [Deinococcus psychrotolerans]